MGPVYITTVATAHFELRQLLSISTEVNVGFAALLSLDNTSVSWRCAESVLVMPLIPFFLSLLHRLCSLTLKKLVVLKELDKELNSLSIAVKIQVGWCVFPVDWDWKAHLHVIAAGLRTCARFQRPDDDKTHCLIPLIDIKKPPELHCETHPLRCFKQLTSISALRWIVPLTVIANAFLWQYICRLSNHQFLSNTPLVHY